jgi:hypothetical protein
MKTWLRLTLVTVTIGGGFTGVAITLQTLFGMKGQPVINYVLITGFVALFAYVTISGLIFVQNPQRTAPLIVALVLQIPWISSPLIAYKFAAGFQVSAAIVGGQFKGGFLLGSDFRFNIFQQTPWGAGINLFALGLLLLLLRAVRPTNEMAESTAAPLDS